MGKIIAGYIAVVCAVGLLMTGSRGGYASAAVGVMIFAVISLALARNWMWREIWLLLVTVLVFAAIGAGYLAYATLHHSDYLSMRVDSAGADAPLRLGLWKAALKQFQLNPIFGTGSGTYLYFGRVFRQPGVPQDPVYAHSDYLQLLAEFGLAGLAGLGAFLFYHLRNGWIFLRDVIARRTVEGERDAPGFHGDNSLALTTGALCSIAALLTHSVGDFNLHIPPNTLVMAFLFGILANPFSVLIPEAKTSSAKAKTFLRWIPLVLPALGVWLAAVALPKWPAEWFADKAKLVLSDWHATVEPDVARSAANFAQQALDRDPNNPDMYLALGDSFVFLAEMEEDAKAREEPYAKAIEAYQRGLQIAPMDVHLVIALAHVFDSMAQFDKAAPTYQRALELDGNSADVQWAYGNHLHLQGDLDRAEEQFNHAIQSANFLPAWRSLERIKEQRAARPAPEAR